MASVLILNYKHALLLLYVTIYQYGILEDCSGICTLYNVYKNVI